MTKEITRLAEKDVSMPDEWARGFLVGFVFGILAPFALRWALSGPIK